MSLRDYITTEDAAKILGISRQGVDYLVSAGKVSADYIGRNKVFKREDIAMLDTARRAGMMRVFRRPK